MIEMRIIVTNTVQATKFASKDIKNCYAVNKNDFLQNIVIYNAKVSGVDVKKLFGRIKLMDDTDILFNKFSYDQSTDKFTINVNAQQEVCLSTIKFIEVFNILWWADPDYS